MSDGNGTVVEALMRVGYVGRSAMYALVGGLALTAAWQGGHAEGTKGALASLRDVAWGQVLLWAIAVALIAYGLWRIADAIWDMDAYGTEMKGIAARLGQAGSGVIYGGFGVLAGSMAMGNSGGSTGAGGGGGAEQAASQAMSLPGGQWLLIIAGLITIGAGGYYIHKGLEEKYKERMRQTSLTERLDPALKAGLIVHGIIVGIIGAFILYAGWQGDPSEAGGVGKAFDAVRSAPFGRILLGLVALGLIGFALQNLVMARHRIIPRNTGPDIVTLSGGFSDKVRARLA
jgi:hypothetical protein